MASTTQYDEAIARAKAALESYSAEAEELAKLYETARKNAQAQYEAQKRESASQASEQKRKAGIETQLAERNYDQRLASRGLALSGENAQTSLDLLVALRNQLAGIDSDLRSRNATLDTDLANKQHEIDLSYANQRASNAEKRANLASELASAEANRESALAAQRAADAAEKAAAASLSATSAGKTGSSGSSGSKSGSSSGKGGSSASKDEEAEETVKGLEEFLAEKGLSAAATDPKGFGQTLGRLSGNTVGTLSGKKATADGVLFGSAIDPEIKAATLAKQLVSSAGGSGKGLTLRQQAAVKDLLDNVLANYRLSETYENELLFNLRSMGYDPTTAATADSVTAELRKEAEKTYNVSYRVAYNLYTHVGYTGEEVAKRAQRNARDTQLRYLYEHSRDEDQFEYVAGELGLSGSLSAFYRQAQKDGLRLGSALQ